MEWIITHGIVDDMSYRFLFQSKDIVVEKLVQFLVGEVDAELLKGVDLGENDRDTVLNNRTVDSHYLQDIATNELWLQISA